MAGPTSTPLGLRMREHQGRRSLKIKGQSTGKEILENGNQKTKKQTHKTPPQCGQGVLGPGTETPASLISQRIFSELAFKTVQKAGEDAILFYKMHSAPSLFSKTVPEQGGKKLACAGISHPQDPLNVCVRVSVQTDLGCQGIGAAHRQALYFSKLEALSDPLTSAYGAKVEEIQGMSENAGV